MRSILQALPILLVSTVLAGQEPAPPQTAPAVLVYERRPMRVPITCRADQFEAAGLHCSGEEPCRIFLELAGVDAVGPKVFLIGNVHTSAATLSSLALVSEDAGGTWREPLKRVPAAGFEAIQMMDAQYVWIAVQPYGQLASDPHLLATNDGGVTWRKFPIWSDEGRTGLLQQFFFDTKDHGFVLIDRSGSGYELYETPNAGLTWLLKEISPRPIAPKWPQRPAPEWRLREDPKSRTYELERRVGATWSRMSSFRTDLGVCKELESTHPTAAPQTPPGPNR